jgi:hypothetical protein
MTNWIDSGNELYRVNKIFLFNYMIQIDIRKIKHQL